MSRSSLAAVYFTAPDEAAGDRLARGLVDAGLVACVNRFPSGRSVYRWDGTVHDESEFYLLAKTTSDQVAAVIDWIE